MRPARRLLDAAFLIELIESRIGIRLQRATKLQMPRGMLAFTIWGVGEPYGGRGGVAPRTSIADIGPQAPRSGLALAPRQHPPRRVRGAQLARGPHVATPRVPPRVPHTAAPAYP